MGHQLAVGFLAAHVKMEIVIANSSSVRCKTNELSKTQDLLALRKYLSEVFSGNL